MPVLERVFSLTSYLQPQHEDTSSSRTHFFLISWLPELGQGDGLLRVCGGTVDRQNCLSQEAILLSKIMMVPHVKWLAKNVPTFFFFYQLLLVSTSLDSTSEEKKTESGSALHVTSEIVNMLQHLDGLRGAGKRKR